MTAATTTAEARHYLAVVEHELADLPVEERAELLDDLAQHLVALAEELDAQPLKIRLGQPTDYAVELRSAAGLPPRAADPTKREVLAALRRRVNQLLDLPSVRGLRDFAPQLLPAWWLVRGYLVVLVPSLWRSNAASDFPVPAPLGSHALGAALVIGAVVASVAVGQRRLPRIGVAAVVAVDLLLAVAAVSILQQTPGRLTAHHYGAVPVANNELARFPLISRSGPITDVFPYSADGKPLHGVLLYDQDGRPLLVGRQMWWADGCLRVVDHPRAADGVPVAFSFPQKYVLDPSGLTLGGGPAAPSQCRATVAPPRVPLPDFKSPVVAKP